MAYIMDERFREPMLPTDTYYNGILEGYRQNGLPVAALKKAWEHAVQEYLSNDRSHDCVMLHSRP